MNFKMSPNLEENHQQEQFKSDNQIISIDARKNEDLDHEYPDDHENGENIA